MSQKFYRELFPIISEALVERITLEDCISKDNAIEQLQASALYPVLEDEFNKVWYYSVTKLYALFKEGAAF